MKTVRFKHDRMQQGFTQVPNAILLDAGLSIGARFTWAVLAHYAWQDERAWPGQDRMAEGMGISEPTLRKYLKELTGCGLLSIERRGQGRTNVYELGPLSRTESPSVQEPSISSGPDRGQLPIHMEDKDTEEEDSGSSSCSPPPSQPSGPDREHEEFAQWLGHHHRITGSTVLRADTAARKKVAGMFRARLAEGYTLDDLQLATEGAFADDFRRENGYFDPESVLRPTKVQKLVDAGRRARKAAEVSGERASKWDAFEAANAAAQGRAA